MRPSTLTKKQSFSYLKACSYRSIFCYSKVAGREFRGNHESVDINLHRNCCNRHDGILFHGGIDARFHRTTDSIKRIGFNSASFGQRDTQDISLTAEVPVSKLRHHLGRWRSCADGKCLPELQGKQLPANWLIRHGCRGWLVFGPGDEPPFRVSMFLGAVDAPPGRLAAARFVDESSPEAIDIDRGKDQLAILAQPGFQ